jgi:amino-acid N-acetyltransferase
MTITGQYTIREATSDDVGPVLALLEAAELPTVGVGQSLRGFLVAESDGTIVGSVGVEHCGHRVALLRSTAVRNDWRGRGVGRRLVGRAIAAADAKGIIALYLLTTTAESYFAELGFVRIERDDAPSSIKATEEFRSGCPASAAVMTLRIPDRTT